MWQLELELIAADQIMYFVGQPVIWLCYSLECSILTHSPCYLPPWSRDPAVVGDLVGQPQKCGPIQGRPTQLFHQIGYVRQKRRCDPTPSMKASAGQPATHRGLCAPLTQLRPRGIVTAPRLPHPSPSKPIAHPNAIWMGVFGRSGRPPIPHPNVFWMGFWVPPKTATHTQNVPHSRFFPASLTTAARVCHMIGPAQVG